MSRINFFTKVLGSSHSSGRDLFGVVDLWHFLDPGQLGRWRPRRQLPLGLLRHTLLELDEDLLKVNTQAFKVSNLLNKVGRKFHLWQVDGALFEHRNGCPDARLGFSSLAKCRFSSRLLEVGFGNWPVKKRQCKTMLNLVSNEKFGINYASAGA